MKKMFLKILQEYPSISSFNELGKSDTHQVIIRDLPEEIKAILGRPGGVLIKGHDGNGNKADVPWIGIHNTNLSPSPTKGAYFAILFAKNGATVNFSIQIGTEDFSLQVIRERISILKQHLSLELKLDFSLSHELDLASNSGRPKKYEAANLYGMVLSRNECGEEEIDKSVIEFF